MTSRELEWFDLETRMRELLHNQLMPIMEKSREDREQLALTKSACLKLQSRLTKLESLIFGDQDHETVLNEIFNKYAETEGNRKKDSVKFDQELAYINEKYKTMSFTLVECNDHISKLSTQVREAEAEILKIQTIVEHNKESVMKEMDNVGRNFRDLNASYTNIALKAEEKALMSYDKSKAIALEIGMYKRELESMWKSHNEMILLARDAKVNKLNIDEFAQSMEEIEEKFKKVTNTLVHFKDEIFHRDVFIDKFYPLKIATMISDSLYHCLELSNLTKFAEYENFILMELNKETLSYTSTTRDIQVQSILERVHHIEDRKTKFLRSSPRKEPKKKQTIKYLDDVDAANVENVSLPPAPPKDILSSFINEAFEDNIVEKLAYKVESEVKLIKNEVQAKVDAIAQNFKGSIDQNNLMMKQVLMELADNSSERKKDKADLSKEISSIKAFIQELKMKLSSSDELANKLAKMMVCIVESIQIQQALDAQDEEDRHNMAQNLDRDLQNELIMSRNGDTYNSTVPSAVFSVKKNCLSCGNATSMLSGIRTSVVYHPTPLFYREKVYQRPELINIKGRLIKTCWDSYQIPFKYEEIEPIFAQASKLSKLVSVNESLKAEYDVKELPFLNLSTSRNRSHKRSRFTIRSSMKSIDNPSTSKS